MFHEEKIGELLAKNTARRVKRELDGRPRGGGGGHPNETDGDFPGKAPIF